MQLRFESDRLATTVEYLDRYSGSGPGQKTARTYYYRSSTLGGMNIRKLRRTLEATCRVLWRQPELRLRQGFPLWQEIRVF